MDTVSAWALGEANRGRKMMVFDWEKAARRIRETGARNAAAGLQSDWEWTGGDILSDGEIIDQKSTYTYLASTWAIPELSLDGNIEECYRMHSQVPDSWYSDDDPEHQKPAHIYWPEPARAILKE